MKILFLSQVLPYPLDAGPKVREYFNLRYLAEKHEVTLLSFVRPTDTDDAVKHLKSFCTRVETVPMARSRLMDGLSLMKSFLTNQPFLITRDEVPEMNFAIRKLIRDERFDMIHADQLWMAPYALEAKEEAIEAGYQPRIILDQHNAVHLIPKRMAEDSHNRFLRTWLKREAHLMANFEVKTCREFDHVVWVTKEDLAAVCSVRSHLRESRYENNGQNEFYPEDLIIPICVDTKRATSEKKVSQSKEILFVGGMHWPPNSDGVIWFVKEVFPLVIKRNPQARFITVGREPPEAIMSISENVIATGYMENVDNYWENARVFVVPLRAGGGMRVKILDAWSKGIPIVSTTIGAEGITYMPGKDILIADSAEDFALAVNKILNDDNLAQSLSQNGRRTLMNCYEWRKIYPAWDYIYPPES